MRLLCLLDYYPRHADWIWAHLPGHRDVVDFVKLPPAPNLFRFSRPLGYLLAGLRQLAAVRARLARGHYDALAAWETKTGFPLALHRRLAGAGWPPLAILSFGNRGLPARFPALMRYALQSAAGLTVPSAGEAGLLAGQLDLPPQRIHVCYNGLYDLPEGYQRLARAGLAASVEPYIFAGGYSQRDFASLLAAAGGLPAPLCIVAPPRRLAARRALPPNVQWLSPLPQAEYLKLLAGAAVVVIPLKAVTYSVGLVDLLTAMAAGKAIVLTRSGGAPEYVDEGENALLTPPGDPGALRQALQRLWDDPAGRQRLGQAARRKYEMHYTYETFARSTYAALCKIAGCA